MDESHPHPPKPQSRAIAHWRIAPSSTMSNSTAEQGTKDETRRSRSLLTEGVLLLALTVFAYVCAYLYQRSYASHFGIPLELVTVDANGLLPLTFIGLFLFMLMFQSYSWYVLWYNSRKDKLAAPRSIISAGLFRRFGAFAVFGCLFLFLSDYQLWSLLYPVFALVFSLVPMPTMTATTVRRSDLLGTLAFNLRYDLLTPEEVKCERVLPPKYYFSCILVLLVLSLSSAAGSGAGHGKRMFSLLSGAPPKLLLTCYGDALVFADYDPTNGIIRRRFSLVDKAQLTNSLSVTNFATQPKIEEPPKP